MRCKRAACDAGRGMQDQAVTRADCSRGEHNAGSIGPRVSIQDQRKRCFVRAFRYGKRDALVTPEGKLVRRYGSHGSASESKGSAVVLLRPVRDAECRGVALRTLAPAYPLQQRERPRYGSGDTSGRNDVAVHYITSIVAPLRSRKLLAQIFECMPVRGRRLPFQQASVRENLGSIA